jgi:hypothetical protein
MLDKRSLSLWPNREDGQDKFRYGVAASIQEKIKNIDSHLWI